MRINIEDQFLGDSRLLYLNKLIGEPLPTTVGRFVFLWMFCSHKRTNILTSRQININSHWMNENEQTFNELLTKADLAEQVGENEYRIRGVAERIAWIEQKSVAGKKSGIARRLKKIEQTFNENEQTPNENEPPTPTPTPTPTLKAISPNGDIPSFDGSTNVNKMVSLWNEHSGALPKIEKITDSRRRKIKTRLSENNDLTYWASLIKKMALSEFCCSGKWATFDWLVANDLNHVKVSEGKYDNKQPLQIVGKAQGFKRDDV